MQATTNNGTSHIVGKLWVGGDWACAHGDLEAPRQVARNLAEYAPRLRDELIALAEACYRDPDRATAAWCRLKERMRGTA